MKGGHMVKSKKSTKSLHPSVHCTMVEQTVVGDESPGNLTVAHLGEVPEAEEGHVLSHVLHPGGADRLQNIKL